MKKAIIKIFEDHPKELALRGFTTFGLSVSMGGQTSAVGDISDDRTALERFVKRLQLADFPLSILRELIDDFLTERYGL